MKLLIENKKLNSELSSKKKKKIIIKFDTKSFPIGKDDAILYKVSE